MLPLFLFCGGITLRGELVGILKSIIESWCLKFVSIGRILLSASYGFLLAGRADVKIFHSQPPGRARFCIGCLEQDWVKLLHFVLARDSIARLQCLFHLFDPIDPRCGSSSWTTIEVAPLVISVVRKVKPARYDSLERCIAFSARLLDPGKLFRSRCRIILVIARGS